MEKHVWGQWQKERLNFTSSVDLHAWYQLIRTYRPCLQSILMSKSFFPWAECTLREVILADQCITVEPLNRRFLYWVGAPSSFWELAVNPWYPFLPHLRGYTHEASFPGRCWHITECQPGMPLPQAGSTLPDHAYSRAPYWIRLKPVTSFLTIFHTLHHSPPSASPESTGSQMLLFKAIPRKDFLFPETSKSKITK